MRGTCIQTFPKFTSQQIAQNDNYLVHDVDYWSNNRIVISVE